MRQSILTILLIISLLQISSYALSCPDGYYDPGSGATRCEQCNYYFSKCTEATKGTFHSSITGIRKGGTTIADAYCYSGGYNSKDNTCDGNCVAGCSYCLIDNDFCLMCENGYVWNSDFTCIPAVVGLEASSLALLFISLIFLIITCIQVNKARK